MIEKLHYVVHTRPDIALSVCMVARFSTNPKENHMMEIKKIMRYLVRIFVDENIFIGNDDLCKAFQKK